MWKFLVAAVLTAAASPAFSATYQAVFTGTVNSGGHDQTGVFGTTGTNTYDGMNFMLTYIYDTSVGSRTTTSTKDTLQGGILDGTATSPVQATLTINGHSVSLSGAGNYGFGSATINYTSSPGIYSFAVQDRTYNYPNDNDWNITMGLSSALLPSTPNLENPIDIALSSTNGYGGTFIFENYNYDTNTATMYTAGGLHADHVTISQVGGPVSPVPLPASGLALTAGLALLAALRRRRVRLPG